MSDSVVVAHDDCTANPEATNPPSLEISDEDTKADLVAELRDLFADFDAGPPEGWQPEASKLQADTELGRPGDSSEIRGTVQEVYGRTKPGALYHLKSCPLCGNNKPLAKGEDVTVQRLDHSLRVTVWADHGHDGQKTTKTGKHVSNHYWRPPIPPFERGDHVELAKALIKDHGEHVSYTPEHGFRVYDERARDAVANPAGGSWRLREPEALERHVAKYAGRPVTAGKSVKALNLRAGDLSGAVKVAKSLLHEDASKYESPWLGFANGDLHTYTREFGAPQPGHRVLDHHVMPFPYAADAPIPPRWEKFLAEVLGDADKIAFLQEFIGACIHGKGAEWQTHPVLVGVGANGKSTLLKVVRALFSVDAVCSSSPSAWSQRFGRSQLCVARLNLVTDMDERELLRDSGSIKAILSADPVEIEKKYKDPYTLTPSAGHLFACNKLPTSADKSEGFYRRFIVLRFDRVFTPEQQDHTLVDHLTTRTVLSGIYTWARLGYERRLARGHYTRPKSHEGALREWREQSDSALAWSAACLRPDPQGKGESAARLYQSYRSWCERTGHRAQSMRSWGETIGVEHQRRRAKAGNVYQVRITPDDSIDGDDGALSVESLFDN